MLISKNADYEAYVRLKQSRNKFGQLLGFEFTHIEPGMVKAIIPIKELHEQQNGFVHGGVTSTFNDMVCGFAAYTIVPQGAQVFTAEIKTMYLRPGIGQTLEAEGRVIKPGKRMHFCESEVYAVNDGKRTLISKATSIMAIVEEMMDDKYGGK